MSRLPTEVTESVTADGISKICEILRIRMVLLMTLGWQYLYFPVCSDDLSDLAFSLGYQPQQFRRMCHYCGLISENGSLLDAKWKRLLKFNITSNKVCLKIGTTTTTTKYYRFDGPVLEQAARSSRSSSPMPKPLIAPLTACTPPRAKIYDENYENARIKFYNSLEERANRKYKYGDRIQDIEAIMRPIPG